METSLPNLNISNQDVQGCIRILENVKIQENEGNFLEQTEYRDKYDGTRLYNRQGPSQVYVSKRAGDESDFWAGGKFCYDDPVTVTGTGFIY